MLKFIIEGDGFSKVGLPVSSGDGSDSFLAFAEENLLVLLKENWLS